MKTGYFAKIASVGRCWSQTHIFKDNGVALCGYKPAPTMSFQWCSDGAKTGYCECRRCKEIALKKRVIIASERLKRSIARVNGQGKRIISQS